jgi:hypothetical protein
MVILNDNLKRKIIAPLHQTPHVCNLIIAKPTDLLPLADFPGHRCFIDDVVVEPLSVFHKPIMRCDEQMEPAVHVLVRCVPEILVHDWWCVGDVFGEDLAALPGTFCCATEETELAGREDCDDVYVA